MSRPRRSIKKAPVIESSSSENEEESPAKKLKLSPESKKITVKNLKENSNDSSSDSDIENYLQPIDKLDLSSPFFNLQKKNEEEFNKIEKNIFDGVSRLSESESDKEDDKNNKLVDDDKSKKNTTAAKLNFQQLEEFTKQIEEAKLHVEKYNAKKKIQDKNQDISNLLAAGESKQLTLENIKEEDLHSSDFETTDEEWEEVKAKDTHEEKSIVPKQNIEIRVGDMPEHVKKKKGVDLLAAMKRRLNRIRKENQIYVHKVHLLCWIAHGNFLNSIINNSEILAAALSLLPSDKCYPSDRPDIGYLEQIVQWYKKTVRLTEKSPPQELTLLNSLKLQIRKKEAFNKNSLVLIFISILRALGIQCRLVLSFQVEPLRPPGSDLHSLSAKDSKVVPSFSKAGKSIIKSKSIVKKDLDISYKTQNKSRRPIKSNETKSSDVKPNLEKLKPKTSSNKGSTSTKKEVAKEVQSSTSKESTLIKDEKCVKNSDKNKIISTSKDTKKAEKNDKASTSTSTRRTSSRNKDVEKQSIDCKREEEISKRGNKTSIKEDVTQKPSLASSVASKEKKSTAKINKDTLSVEGKTSRSKSTSQVEDKIKKTNKHSLTVEEKKPRSKSASTDKKLQSIKTATKSTNPLIKIKLPTATRSKKKEENKVPQLDGANDEKKPKKVLKKDVPNLKKLKNKTSEKVYTASKHSKHVTSSFNNDDSESEFSTSPLKKSPQRGINFSKLKSPTTSNPFDIKNDIVNLIKGRIAEQKVVDRRRLVSKRKLPTNDSDSDSDYMQEEVKKKHHDSDSDIEYFAPKPKVKKRIKVKKEDGRLKVLSSDDEAEKKKKKGINVWLEVFLESEEKWISADVIRGQVHCVNELFVRASHPVNYVVAWNNDNTLKDVTRRYCKNFNTVTRKLRIDAKWWEESINPFLEKKSARSKEEDDDLNRQQLDKPLPTTISEYKNHPLYALQRHILKFEAIYPSDTIPLGYVRGEPVYPRNCVYVCRSREIWLKEAKVVKHGEKPYKIVKARPKYDRLSNQMITGQLLEIFGEWQTTDYEPPTAENGIVPRNAYGNVELFKPCMLPKGTVLLKLAGLNKVCRKLNIDCASAVVGFDFHGGWSHPVYDGFVVCKEHEDTCIAAWHQEQEEIEKKENEKIDKRVYTNWKKLIKGLLIKERLKARYDFGGETSAAGKGTKKASKGPRFTVKKRRSPLSGSESDSD